MLKFRKTSKGYLISDDTEDLLGIINVQTGLISQLNEELLQLRLQHVTSQKELKDFMAREGFNYPKL